MSDRKQKRPERDLAPASTTDDWGRGDVNSQLQVHYTHCPANRQVDVVNRLIDQALRSETRAFARADVCAALGYHERAPHWDELGERHGAIRRELEALAWKVASHG